MKILLLSVLAVAMIGVMIPSVHAEEVPSWVKNTAGWWADDKIGEDEFLNSIQYLIESKIIVLEETFEINSSTIYPDIELPNKYDPPLIHQFSGRSSGTLLGQAQIVITAPDKSTEKFTSIIKNGEFGLTYQITSEHQLGTFFIKAYSGDKMIWESKFSVYEKHSEHIPSWIKNNGKWWNEGKIPDSAFLDGIKFLIENGIIDITEDSKVMLQSIHDVSGVIPFDIIRKIDPTATLSKEGDYTSAHFMRNIHSYIISVYTSDHDDYTTIEDWKKNSSSKFDTVTDDLILENPEIYCNISYLQIGDGSATEAPFTIQINAVSHHKCWFSNVLVSGMVMIPDLIQYESKPPLYSYHHLPILLDYIILDNLLEKIGIDTAESIGNPSKLSTYYGN